MRPGTTINADGWKSYDHTVNSWFAKNGFKIIRVCHKRNFVCPMTGACTNSIEATWRWAKRLFLSRYPSPDKLPGWFALYSFLKFSRNGSFGQSYDPFLTLLDFIKEAQDLVESGAIDPKEEIRNFIKDYSGEKIKTRKKTFKFANISASK